MFWLNFEENNECLAACNFLQARLHALAHTSFWSNSLCKAQIRRKTEFLARMQLFLAACALLRKSLHKWIAGIFLCNGRSLVQWIYVMTPRLLPQSFWYVMADPCITYEKGVLQVWLLVARWTTWELRRTLQSETAVWSHIKTCLVLQADVQGVSRKMQ